MKVMHSIVVKCGMDLDVLFNNTILAAYGKCGELGYLKRYFGNMEGKNMVSWNSIISGYYRKGEVEEAHRLFEMMYSGFSVKEIKGDVVWGEIGNEVSPEETAVYGVKKEEMERNLSLSCYWRVMNTCILDQVKIFSNHLRLEKDGNGGYVRIYRNKGNLCAVYWNLATTLDNTTPEEVRHKEKSAIKKSPNKDINPSRLASKGPKRIRNQFPTT
ncbi:hypothetical protein AgCh_040114 [Apium graveolens]